MIYVLDHTCTSSKKTVYLCYFSVIFSGKKIKQKIKERNKRNEKHVVEPKEGSKCRTRFN